MWLVNPSNVGQWEYVPIHRCPSSTKGTSQGRSRGGSAWAPRSFLNFSAALQAASGHCLPQFGSPSSAKWSYLLGLLPLGRGWCSRAWHSPSLGEEVSRKSSKWNCTGVKPEKLFLQMQFNGHRISLSHAPNFGFRNSLLSMKKCLQCRAFTSQQQGWVIADACLF